MKISFLIILMLLCGCRALDKKIVQMSGTTATKPALVSMENRNELVVLPPVVTLVPDANDASYLAVSNAPDPAQFQVRAEVSPDLKRWFYFYQFEDSPTIEFPRFQPVTFVRLVGVPWPTPEQP